MKQTETTQAWPKTHPKVHKETVPLTVSEDAAFWKLSPCAQMLSVTNAICSASSTNRETRNRAHLFKSSTDYKRRKEKRTHVISGHDLHMLAYPTPGFFR